MMPENYCLIWDYSMQLPVFVLSTHCNSRAHCKTCRNKQGGHKWRESLKKAFAVPNDVVDFDCPYGMTWNDETVTKFAEETVAAQTSETTTVRTVQQQRDSGSRGASKGCGCSRK